jgi:hypothetical protein
MSDTDKDKGEKPTPTVEQVATSIFKGDGVDIEDPEIGKIADRILKWG